MTVMREINHPEFEITEKGKIVCKLHPKYQKFKMNTTSGSFFPSCQDQPSPG